MAKIKVHELAKEIDVTSKEVIACLNDLGIEGKTASSGLEDDQASKVKNKLKGSSAAPAAPAAKAEAPAAEAPKAAAPAAPAKPAAAQPDAAPKKKKSTIIVVSGKHNGHPSNRPQGQNQGGRPQQGNNNGRPQNQSNSGRPMQQGLIKPTVPTSAARQARYAEANPQEGNRNAAQQLKENNTSVQKADKETVQISNNTASDNSNSTQSSAGTVSKAAEQLNTQPQRPANNNDNREQRPYRDNNQGGQRGDFRNSRDNNQGGQRGDYRNNRDGRDNRDNRDNNRGGQRGDFRNNRDNNQGGQRGDFRNNRDGARPSRDGQQGGQRNDRNDRNGQRPSGGNGYNKGGVIINQSKNYGTPAPAKDEKNRNQRDDRRKNDKKKDDRFGANEDGFRGGKPVKGAKVAKLERPDSKKKEEVVEEKIKVITIPENITIKDLADKMKVPSAQIIKKLFLQGQIVTVNEEVSYETAEEIALEYEILCEKEVVVDVIEELLKEEEENVEEMTSRPPVVCVMGHVDHGKTSLLDAIRNTKVIDKEAGGITQAIGAYVVNINGQNITFLDTPGHEAFTAMRMRGANATDIAILVVAADDGVMPQTVEAINHAKAAGVEIIVAVNKIDKPSANIDRVKQELSEYELIPEDWGGSTVFAPVSAKTGEGVEELLEMILLTSDILELKANANRKARGMVIEAQLDKGRGPVATVLVQKGTLKVGDFIAAGACHGKVRAMIDDNGRRVKEAGPSKPVEILGLDSVPGAGEIFVSLDSDKEAKNFADTFIAQNKAKLLADTKAKMSLDDLFSQIQAGNLKELNLIIKADVQGSVEAVKESLLKLSNDEVVVKAIHSGVGAINESDVILASASKAIIIGFNVRPDATAKATAETEDVDIRLYDVIYKAIEDVDAAMKGMLDPVFEEKITGHVEIRQIFKASGIGNIAGSYVLDGTITRGAQVRITRQGELVHEGKLASLKRFKDDVKEVKSGFECGLVFDGYNDFQELDIVEAFVMVEVPRT